MPDFNIRFSNDGLPARACRPASLLVLGAVLLASCGSNAPTVPTAVTRAVISVSVEPTPIVATQNALTLAVTAPYKITIAETAGLGGEIVFVSASVFEPATGKQVVLNYYDAADLVVYVGKKRIEPAGTLSFSQTASYTLSDQTKAAILTVSAQFKDDRGNLANASILVNIQ